MSNALVPTQRMPPVLQAIADWNPVSAVAAAARTLFGKSQPVGLYPGLADATPGRRRRSLWSVALFAVFAPLAAFLYRRRTDR